MKKNEEDNLEKNEIEMPSLQGLTLKEANKILKELELEIEIEGEGNGDAIVKDQLPKKGIEVYKGTKITVYVE